MQFQQDYRVKAHINSLALNKKCDLNISHIQWQHKDNIKKALLMYVRAVHDQQDFYIQFFLHLFDFLNSHIILLLKYLNHLHSNSMLNYRHLDTNTSLCHSYNSYYNLGIIFIIKNLK